MVLVCNTTWAKSSDLWHEADNTLFSNKDFTNSSQQPAKKASSEKGRQGRTVLSSKDQCDTCGSRPTGKTREEEDQEEHA